MLAAADNIRSQSWLSGQHQEESQEESPATPATTVAMRTRSKLAQSAQSQIANSRPLSSISITEKATRNQTTMTVTQANRTREQQLHQRVVSSTTQLLCINHCLPPWTPTTIWRSDTTGNRDNGVPTYGRLTLIRLNPVSEYPGYPTSSLGRDTPMLSTQLPQSASHNRVNNEPCAICKKQTTRLQHAARALNRSCPRC